MNRHSLRVIEFEKVRTMVRDRCLTERASAILRKEKIATEPDVVSAKLDLVGELRRLLESTVRFPSVSFPNLSTELRTLDVEGTVLEPEQIAAVQVFLSSATSLQHYLQQALSEVQIAGAELCHPDLEVSDLAKYLARFVDPDGSVREREIPELRQLRSEITRAHQGLQKQAASMASSDEVRSMLSSTVPTQRDGRTLLAVKASHRGRLRGIVHEVSSTGSTIFLEPDTLVELNNAVVESEQRYRSALIRILRELTVRCRGALPQISDCEEWVTSVDLILARARFGRDLQCTRADQSGERILLRDARHPLLGDQAVPIEVEIPAGKRVLIVTGPNTGGKTVSLKTVGLFGLMNQFGLELPAAPGTELPVFSGVYADIGDEQSIEQNLSTFSGHMRNISRILNHADANSLVLLDELGSGTDPEEGGALAMAILDELLERHSFTIITTHHGRLKHYGFTHEQAANASMEFDATSLRPTYHILPGVPGSSHAVEIASQMGVRRTVTKQARHYLEGEEYDTGRIIRRLTDREQELHGVEQQLADERGRIEKLEKEIDAERARLAARERDLREGRLRELERWSAEQRSRLENLVRELREGELTQEKTRGVKEFIEETQTELDAERERLRESPTVSAASPGREFASGDTVRLRSTAKEGVIDRAGKGDSWIVQIGNVRMPVASKDLEPLERRSESRKAQVSYSTAGAGRAVLELDVRGRRLDEALAELDRQLDQALLGGMEQFGVIHGMGEGILQRGIRDALRSNPHVESISYAAPEDGGFGKTIVQLG